MTEPYDGKVAFHAKTRTAWRKWLEKNHNKENGVWLIIFHKKSNTTSVYYDEAVEEALCFGWIDSIKRKRDSESAYQFFSTRKPKSKWSKINRERVNRMIRAGKMTAAGQQMITLAMKTGTWTALDEAQNGVIPPDLQTMLDKHTVACKNFMNFPPSSKRIILEWIQNAKRPETRKKRIEETIKLAKKNIRANHYQKKD